MQAIQRVLQASKQLNLYGANIMFNNQHALSIHAANTAIAAFHKQHTQKTPRTSIAAMLMQTAAAQPAQPKAVAAEPAANNAKRVPKSQLVRNRIAEAKAANETPDVVIAWAMENLGQSKALATRYVVENWGRDQTPARGTCKLTVGISTRGIMPREVTKAQQVREAIAAAKANGQDAEEVVEWAVANLQMSKSQAKQYVSNNWERA